MIKYLVVLAVIVFDFAEAFSQVESVISKHLKAVGGQVNLASIKSSVITGANYNGGEEGNISVSIVRGLGCREIYDFVFWVNLEIRSDSAWIAAPGCNGGWRNPLSAEEFKSINFGVEPIDDFVNYREKGYEVRLDSSSIVIRGMTCSLVRMTSRTGNTRKYYIDNGTGLLIRDVSKQWIAAICGVTEIQTDYYDFQQQHGIMVAMRRERITGDNPIDVTVVEKIDFEFVSAR